MTVGASPVRAGPAGGRAWIASAVVAVATVIILIGLALLPFLNPIWVGLGQERAEADAWTGWSMATVHDVTNAVLVDLVVGPPDFDQVVDGEPVFNEREIGHLQDVRTVLVGFVVAVAISIAAVVLARLAVGPRAVWRGVRIGSTMLIAGVVALGILSLVAFELVFEVFHRLFFASGTYAFDPATERLVQLFPMQFWFETSIALGIVLVGLGAIALVVAERRLRGDAAAAPRAAAIVDPAGSGR